ncbi:1601_t:CDS:2 [Entrophospora sp. SA101]|nr:1601_t:CDS:2 [Entrophospora sp. SA101]
MVTEKKNISTEFLEFEERKTQRPKLLNEIIIKNSINEKGKRQTREINCRKKIIEISNNNIDATIDNECLPKFTPIEPPTDLINSLKEFLPKIKEDNERLEKLMKQDPKAVNMEYIEDDSKGFIELDLGLGVFSSIDNESSDEIDGDTDYYTASDFIRDAISKSPIITPKITILENEHGTDDDGDSSSSGKDDNSMNSE